MSQVKFGRNYVLTVQVDNEGDAITVSYPLTIEFDINRKLYSSANEGLIRVYNLSPQHRGQVQKAPWNLGIYRQIQLRAGYGGFQTNTTPNLPVIFQGNISEAQSMREGVNFITTIDAFDGGFAYSYSQNNGNPLPTFPIGTPNETVIKGIAGTLPKTTVGAVGTYNNQAGTGASFSEPGTDVLSRYTNGGFFIDNETVNCLNANEVIADNNVLVISAASGLLGTPKIESQFLFVDMIFEPSVYIGQQVLVKSSTFTKTVGIDIQGLMKVNSIHHRGTISGTTAGDAVTTLGLDFSQNSWTQVPKAVN